MLAENKLILGQFRSTLLPSLPLNPNRLESLVMPALFSFPHMLNLNLNSNLNCVVFTVAISLKKAPAVTTLSLVVCLYPIMLSFGNTRHSLVFVLFLSRPLPCSIFSLTRLLHSVLSMRALRGTLHRLLPP